MALDIKDKAALVTGAGSGICLALTKKLLAGGCNVVIADLALRPEAEDVVAQWKEGRVVFVKTDVTDWKQLRAAFDKTMETFGRLDLVVPGAAVFEPTWSNFWQYDTPETRDTDEASSYKSLDINLSHPIRATQLAIDYFVRQNVSAGVVCHCVSIVAQLALVPAPLYCVSKHALAAFIHCLADLEPQRKIRVNGVAPGIVKTPLWSEGQLGWVDDEVDTWLSADRVAGAMMELIMKEEFVGGTVLEVSAEKTRKVEMLNNPGPEGTGWSLARVEDALIDAKQLVEKNFGKEK